MKLGKVRNQLFQFHCTNILIKCHLAAKSHGCMKTMALVIVMPHHGIFLEWNGFCLNEKKVWKAICQWFCHGLCWYLLHIENGFIIDHSLCSCIVIEKKAFVAFRLIRDHHKIIPEKVYTPKRKKKKSFQSSWGSSRAGPKLNHA